MRLTFGPDDESPFEKAKTTLLESFEAWLGQQQIAGGKDAAEMAGAADLVLDWKFRYGDGELGLWTTADIAEFLLEWCPRKLSVSQEDCEGIPVSLAALTAFLDDQGLLARASSSVPELAATAVELTPDFVEAMGDPADFGMAKSLFASATAEGIDTSDPDQLQDWMAEFNARPEEDRRRVISEPGMAIPPRRPAMPPVVPPPDADVAASRAAAPILAKFAALADFLKDGRKLTQKGNLTLADARALVTLLDTGDVIDPEYGSRTFKTTSSAELFGLRQIFAWAKKAGVVRVAHGRAHATKKGLAIASDPGAFFDRSVDALLAIGPLTSQRKPDGWLAWPEVDDLLDQFTVALLSGPYVTQRPMAMEDLCAEAADAVLETFSFSRSSDEEIGRRVTTDVVDMVDVLELAGMVRRIDAGDPEDADVVFRNRRQGGSVELTAAGVETTRRLLTENGYEAPTAGQFTDATATELLLGTNLDDFPTLAAEIEAWRRRRSPEQAAHELADAARALPDPALKNIALAAIGEIDVEVAGPEVRILAADPACRGFALCWLVDHGMEQPSALFDPEDVSWFVDVLAQRIVTGGPEGLLATLALAGDHDAQVAVIGRLWRQPSPATEVVLAAIGEVHRVKVVAKAARKALFQRRSWNGPF